jgi:hypothetical protein
MDEKLPTWERKFDNAKYKKTNIWNQKYVCSFEFDGKSRVSI